MSKYIVKMDLYKNSQLLRANDFGLSNDCKLTSIKQCKALVSKISWLLGIAVGIDFALDIKQRNKFSTGAHSSEVMRFSANGLDLDIEIIKLNKK